MRSLLLLALAIVITPAARAQEEARAVIEKAVQAHGGAALDKYPAGRAKAKAARG